MRNLGIVNLGNYGIVPFSNVVFFNLRAHPFQGDVCDDALNALI